MKVSREEIEQLAKALRVSVPVGASGAAVFRLCLDRVLWLFGARTPEQIAAQHNARELEALGVFSKALGGQGEADATEESGRPPPNRDAC